jgi:hypothetical protein
MFAPFAYKTVFSTLTIQPNSRLREIKSAQAVDSGMILCDLFDFAYFVTKCNNKPVAASAKLLETGNPIIKIK